jgi:hypothetical protein
MRVGARLLQQERSGRTAGITARLKRILCKGSVFAPYALSKHGWIFDVFFKIAEAYP